MRKQLKDVDMDAVTKYMLENDCNIDEAITAVKKQTGIIKRTPIKEAVTKLKAVRLQAGLSQSQLAKEADLNLRTLQAYEAGGRSFDNARIDTILKVALACNCSIEELIENKEYLELLNKYKDRG